MSKACFHLPISGINEQSSGQGYSAAAVDLNKIKKEAIEDSFQPISRGLQIQNTLDDLKEIYEENSKSNWDGHAAKPVSYDSFCEANEFISRLTALPYMPEIVPEPSGKIGLEWYRDKNRVFVVSFNGLKQIQYAGIYGINKTHGVEYFEGFIPKEIIEYIHRVFN